MPSPSAASSHAPTVLFLAANPRWYERLDLEGEIRAIEAELEAVARGQALRFLHRPAATPSTLQRVLLDERPAVVQFSGHGRGSGRLGSPAHRTGTPRRDVVVEDPGDEPALRTGIVLHADDGGSTTVTGEALGHLLAHVGQGVRLVFLNACHSAEQASALVEHVDFVVGMADAIEDEAARVFAVALYRALAHGRTIQDAFGLGVNALMLAGLDANADLPVLCAREGADPRRARLVAAVDGAEGSPWHVFLSYAKADRAAASELARALDEQAIRAYFDERERTLGSVMPLELSDAIDDSLHGLMVMSTESMADGWLREQYAALLTKAVEDRRRLIPVIVGRDEVKLPAFLRTRHHVDLRGKSGEAHDAELDAIARAIRGERGGPPPRQR